MFRERVRVPTVIEGPSMTVQSLEEETDINAIMRKYSTRPVPELLISRGPGIYGDFSGGEDYLEATLKVQAAREVFMKLPSGVRSYCRNDPALLLELVHDPSPEARAKCIELGLVKEAGPSPEELELRRAAGLKGLIRDAVKEAAEPSEKA